MKCREALQKQAENWQTGADFFWKREAGTNWIYCRAFREAKIAPERIKPILKVEEKGMEIESRLISLAAWIAREYGSTMNQALKDRPSRKSEGKDKGETVSLSAGKRRNLCRAFRGIQKKAL